MENPHYHRPMVCRPNKK